MCIRLPVLAAGAMAREARQVTRGAAVVGKNRTGPSHTRLSSECELASKTKLALFLYLLSCVCL